MLSIKVLVDDNSDTLKFNWYLSDLYGGRMLSSSEESNTTAADLIGHLNIMHPQRVQVFGVVEIDFFLKLDNQQTEHYLTTLKEGQVPAIIIAEDIPPPRSIIEFCEINKVPLLTSPVDASRIIDVLRVYLTRRFAPKTTVHGVFLDVLGVGVLITGESGLGKSELALELISRGHGLVADDAVEFARTYPNYIEGRCPELLRNLLEVRGLGLLDIRTIFGETAVRRKMSLKLIVNLVRANTEFFERLPMQDQSEEILGMPIKKVTLQVAAGRNLAVLVEAAVRNMVLKIRGIDTLSDFMKKQSEAILKNSKI
ncbi:HPr(Ser) kinase/phosphatase [Taylorella equigenitalis]|uniref:HPr kinase/phosphorylase n=3 Tax=Taylorella equigenitalis TaxID=29575 RepID=A0A654KH43_TAYEM|nr:HPr(Ser) kinase/phosphatase [Taylorella equigenitalis]ADU91788.1 HPr kinase/phosphorylase [Taylorella equigenitalis MCE9]AFN35353.1 HPr kinase/phosphorylase [Taylorella equigenitalis ATCC 35865]ASY30013.1 HPr kinase/phosphorylase [Taylorella equigenitalis]ASY37318.1 HPr kinase/phosphorylase [Taylorella equigenitalis]ASY38784.1 HPr kinase/phosphorylase [Taylorella equigenitalis]